MLRARFTFVAVVAALAIPTVAAAAPLTLSDPTPLPNSLPGTGQMSGGEPSLSFDPTGNERLYSVAPNGGESDNGTGVNFWASPDGGNSWDQAKAIGSAGGGGDADVEVGIDHKVYVLDLEIASSAVCRSTDFGKTFSDGCETGTAEDQAGAEEDRQWITHDPNDANTTYFNYHDLTVEAPLIEKSSDGGASFAPCGNLLNPASALFPASVGNTIVGKSAVAKDGMIYVPIGSPTTMQAATSGSATPSYGQIVVAHHKGCNGDQFDNTTVYANDGGSFFEPVHLERGRAGRRPLRGRIRQARRQQPLQHLHLGLARPREDVLEDADPREHRRPEDERHVRDRRRKQSR